MTKKIRKAVLPVAGLGTRFLPATKAMPKEMLPVVDKPLIQYAVEEAFAAGIEDVILITGRGKTAIENHFDRNYELESNLDELQKPDYLSLIKDIVPPGCRLISTRQGEPLGLGHAIWCARSIIGREPFAVLLADDIFDGPRPVLPILIEEHDKLGGNIVSVMEVPQELTSRYGIVSPGQKEGACIEIMGLVEKPSPGQSPSNLAISGRYILQPEVFDRLEMGKRGVGGEIQLTDAMSELIGQQPFHGLIYEGKRFDCGSTEGWLEANLNFALKRPELRQSVSAMLDNLNHMKTPQ